jgi:hypothetical protein
MAGDADFLSSYFSSAMPKSGPSNIDIARYILLNADISKVGVSKNQGEGNEPSFMSRIFDILSRPNYAIAETIRTGSPLGFFKGLSGEKKTTFSDVLKEYGVENDVARGTGGFFLDVLLDPTTWIPGGAIAKGAKALTKTASKAPVVIPKTLPQKLLQKGTPVHPGNFGMPSTSNTIPIALKKPTDESTVPLNFLGGLLTAQRNPGKLTTRASDTIPGQLELPFDVGDVPKTVPEAKKTELSEPSVDDLFSEPPTGVPGQIPFKIPGFNASQIRKQTAQQIPESTAKTLQPQPKLVPDKRDIKDASEIVAGWDPKLAKAEINKTHPETLNAKQQVKLYYKARDAARKRFKNPNAPANLGRINAIAVKIYNQIEAALERSGYVPRLGTGENVKLSDIISQVGDVSKVEGIAHEFGNGLIPGSETWQAVENLRAKSAVADAPIVKDSVEKVQQAATETRTSNVLSDSQQTQVERVLKQIAQASTKAKGGTPAAVKATEQLVTDALNAGKSAATIATEQKAKIINQIVAGGAKAGKLRPQVNAAITRGLESDLDKIPRWAQNDNKAVEFLMGRVATWWGQRDLRPLSLNAIGAASSTAQARGKALDKLFGPLNIEQRHEAWRLAQGIGAPTSEATYQLATQINRLMNNMCSKIAGQSVIMRSCVSMDNLNKWLTRYKVGFNFTNKTVQDSYGRVFDYSKGADWVNSWKSHVPTEDPKVFVFKLQQAMEQATREKALFDELGERFGTKAPGGPWRNKIDYPYLEGYYFTDDIAKQLPRVIRDWSSGPWNTNNKLLSLYDRVLSMWKAGVTIYRPGHHVRNMVGDVYLGFMDGVVSVRPYVLAARVQRTLKSSYSDLMDVDKLVELGALGKQYGTPMPGEVIFKNKSGVRFTADQIAAVAHQKGLLEHARTLEDIIDLGEGSKFRPFGGRVQSVARGASELQSHNARLAHFIDKVMKSRGTNLEKIFEEASRRARKWHPTGLDLTDFERKVMRRIIPFYSWLRKSTPLLIEGIVMNPGKTVVPAKLWDAIQETQGIETPGRHDPFPVDQMFPEWIRAQGLGPISTGDGFLGRFSDQMPPGYVMGGMGLNPLADLMSQAQDPGRTLLSGLTPAVGIPLELAQGRKTFTGEPITGPEARPGAFGQYVGENIPLWSALQGITGTTPFGGETSRAARSDEAGKESFVNWLTGLGIRGTGPYIRQSRFEAQAPFKVQQRSNRDAFLEYLRQQGV